MQRPDVVADRERGARAERGDLREIGPPGEVPGARRRRSTSAVQLAGSGGRPSASTALKNGLDLASDAKGVVVSSVMFALGWAARMRSKAGNASTMPPRSPSLITSTRLICFTGMAASGARHDSAVRGGLGTEAIDGTRSAETPTVRTLE